MKNGITQALIYENQGLHEQALEIYEKILASDPANLDAKSGIYRVNFTKRTGLNPAMLGFFLNLESIDEINEFKRWLIKI